MALEDGVADLHLHTTASDGTDTLEERLVQAADRGLETIAITDHDRLDESFSSRRTTRRGIEVVAGVEVRADVDGTKVEILGYFVDPVNPTLVDILGRARQYRIDRNREMVERLEAELDLGLGFESLREEADGQLGRPDVARELLKAGVVETIGEAFDRFLGPKGSAYVPMERVPSAEVLEAIKSAGGVASLAHPGRIRTDQDRAVEIVETLAETGLDGIEVWYPYGRSSEDDAYAGFTVEDAAELADTYDLLPTGGSDCHGTESDKYRIGDVRMPARAYGDVLDLAERRMEFAADSSDSR